MKFSCSDWLMPGVTDHAGVGRDPPVGWGVGGGGGTYAREAGCGATCAFGLHAGFGASGAVCQGSSAIMLLVVGLTGLVTHGLPELGGSFACEVASGMTQLVVLSLLFW